MKKKNKKPKRKNRFDRMKINLSTAKRYWKLIEEFVNGLKDKEIFVGLREFCRKDLKVSKNTAKLYIRLAKENKLKFFTHIAGPKTRGFEYPLGLTNLVAEHYSAACLERSKITKGKKTRITFQTFINTYSQEYEIDNIVYKPKPTFICGAIKFHGLYSQLCTHKTKQGARFRKTMAQKYAVANEEIIRAVGSEELLKIIKRDLTETVKNAPLRKLDYEPGARVEIDASKEQWGREQWTVYTAIDSSTGFKVAEYIEKEETNYGYLCLLKSMFEQYGIPLQIVTDRRRGWDGKSVAQIRDFVEKLGAKLYVSSDPNAKPKVERSFRTMENDFYYNELRKRGAFTLEEASKYMDEIKDAYNKRYGKTLDYENSCYMPMREEQWNEVKIKYSVKFKTTQTLNFRGVEYGLFDSRGNRIFHREGYVDIKINSKLEMYVMLVNVKLYLRKDWQEKKCVALTPTSIQHLIEGLKNSSDRISKKEMNILIETIGLKLEKQKSLVSV